MPNKCTCNTRPYYFYLFRKTLYSTEIAIYRGRHFLFLWKPEFSLTPLFI